MGDWVLIGDRKIRHLGIQEAKGLFDDPKLRNIVIVSVIFNSIPSGELPERTELHIIRMKRRNANAQRHDNFLCHGISC
jgi:hypothetical protein